MIMRCISSTHLEHPVEHEQAAVPDRLVDSIPVAIAVLVPVIQGCLYKGVSVCVCVDGVSACQCVRLAQHNGEHTYRKG